LGGRVVPDIGKQRKTVAPAAAKQPLVLGNTREYRRALAAESIVYVRWALGQTQQTHGILFYLWKTHENG